MTTTGKKATDQDPIEPATTSATTMTEDCTICDGDGVFAGGERGEIMEPCPCLKNQPPPTDEDLLDTEYWRSKKPYEPVGKRWVFELMLDTDILGGDEFGEGLENAPAEWATKIVMRGIREALEAYMRAEDFPLKMKKMELGDI
jgi:hypothetical protein